MGRAPSPHDAAGNQTPTARCAGHRAVDFECFRCGLLFHDVPDVAAIVARGIARLLVVLPVIERLALEGPLLGAVVAGRDGVIANLSPGALHISSSTISVALSQHLTEQHAKKRQHFVAAPVFGRPDVAAAGRLFVVVGGEAVAVEKAASLLDAIGQKMFVISDTPKAANLVKLSGNFLGASVIEALGEAMALVGKAGIDERQYLKFLTSTLFDAPIYKTYGSLIADGRFTPPGFAAPLGQKDIRLVLAAAEDLRVPMPVASLLRDRFLNLLAHGGDRLDWSAIGRLPAADAGTAAFSTL